jgi:hypothetical protein
MFRQERIGRPLFGTERRAPDIRIQIPPFFTIRRDAAPGDRKGEEISRIKNRRRPIVMRGAFFDAHPGLHSVLRQLSVLFVVPSKDLHEKQPRRCVSMINSRAIDPTQASMDTIFMPLGEAMHDS